jgi:hypothetical protein
MSRRRQPGVPKRKKCTVILIPRQNPDGSLTEPYEIMESIIAGDRADLCELKFGIAWKRGWKADADGLLPLGKCCKSTEIMREIGEFDFVMLLNEKAWASMEPQQKVRLVFHELCHAEIAKDENGEDKHDEKGRLVTRIRKHNIEDFREVVEKFGWKEDLAGLVKEQMADRDQPLLAGLIGADPGGWPEEEDAA